MTIRWNCIINNYYYVRNKGSGSNKIMDNVDVITNLTVILFTLWCFYFRGKNVILVFFLIHHFVSLSSSSSFSYHRLVNCYLAPSPFLSLYSCRRLVDPLHYLILSIHPSFLFFLSLSSHYHWLATSLTHGRLTNPLCSGKVRLRWVGGRNER